MPYKPTWKERLEDIKPYTGPMIAGTLALALLGWLGWWGLGLHNPTRTFSEPPKDETARSAAIQRVAGEVDVLEKTYLRALESDAQADTALNRVIEKQRELIRLQPAPTPEQTDRLARLEAARGSQQSRAAQARSLLMEKEAEVAQKSGQGDEATEKLREALRLQREANAAAAKPELRDVAREARLVQEIAGADAAPLRATVASSLALARSAVAQEKWDEALAAYAEARKAQADLNQQHPASRFADPAGLDKIDGEIQGLRSAGLVATAMARERDAEAAAKGGRTQEAAAFYAAAGVAVREVRAKFPLSTFATDAKIDDLEVRRQTALSAGPLARAAAIDREVAEALRRRQNTAAGEKLAAAARLVETVARDFPRSRSLDPALQRRLGYLALRTAELDTLQEQVYSRLARLPGAGGAGMLTTEVPQELYQRVMNANPSRVAGRGLPVDSVNLQDVREFCERLSWLLGRRVRLPLEAEVRAVWTGGGEGAWSAVNSAGHSRETGRSPATPAGFYDLAGNLAEWLQPRTDEGETAPVAGGSYLDPATALKTFKVDFVDKRERMAHIGFRVVVEGGVE